MIPDNLTWEKVIHDMSNCEQFPGVSVLKHGRSVYQYYNQIRDALETDKLELLSKWKLPSWIYKYREDLAWELHDHSTVMFYIEYHDIGKPYSLIIDEDGKKHFPNHAEISRKVWNLLPFLNKSEAIQNFHELIGDLIFHDMDLHLIKDKDLDEWLKNKDIKTVITLLITALAEIHSNAEYMGGLETASFKAKLKQITRRGGAICSRLFGDKNV